MVYLKKIQKGEMISRRLAPCEHMIAEAPEDGIMIDGSKDGPTYIRERDLARFLTGAEREAKMDPWRSDNG